MWWLIKKGIKLAKFAAKTLWWAVTHPTAALVVAGTSLLIRKLAKRPPPAWLQGILMKGERTMARLAVMGYGAQGLAWLAKEALRGMAPRIYGDLRDLNLERRFQPIARQLLLKRHLNPFEYYLLYPFNVWDAIRLSR